jgi:hypothetical protein
VRTEGRFSDPFEPAPGSELTAIYRVKNGKTIATPPLWRGFFWGSFRCRGIPNSPGSLRCACCLQVVVDIDLLPRDYYQVGFELDDALLAAPPCDLPRGWDRQPPYHPEVQASGDTWVRSGSSLALRVPASVLPSRSNILINPAHPEMPRLREIERKVLPWPGRATEFLEGLRKPGVAGKGRRRRRGK